MERVIIHQPSRPAGLSPFVGCAAALVWFAILSVAPDPRPLGAPDVAVNAVSKITSLADASARAATALLLRACGLGLLGFLVAMGCSRLPRWQSIIVTFVGAPILAIAAMWANYGYFPISLQIQFAIAFTIIGAATELALRANRTAKLMLVLGLAGFFMWAIPRGVSTDLERSARIAGVQLLSNAEDIPAGDPGFAECVAIAFQFAEENSPAADPVHTNQAAILALGVILGDEHVATLARSAFDGSHHKAIGRLRRKVKLHGRGDLPRHYWVSAALSVLSDGNRSTAVGAIKELMDSNPGGSGFSFADLTADRAGVLLAQRATQNAASALAFQAEVRDGLKAGDYCPPVAGLPEGISREQFQSVYGGLGGERTNQILDEIKQRLQQCRALGGHSEELIEVQPL
ncbi:hypothetical protein [Roseiconus lacunae]|uniref:hypothetical protein n=1 Tax=Roseiconus lacunae TaxID=2605694 RepID=UPI001E4AB948|nr:hypothetical protein [Roseiconus lacunae]MCD0460243.1 hypothetical protein [Roseiconus lacunae]